MDRAGLRHLPVGDDGFERAAAESVIVDKTLLVRDVLRGGAVNLFCRPRRFGKTLALTMLRSYFEDTGPLGLPSCRELFERLAIWDADGGAYRRHQGTYPVIYLSMKDAKRDTWPSMMQAMADMMADEYRRHDYLLEGGLLDSSERAYFGRVKEGALSADELIPSLLRLARYLTRHHGGTRAVILIDEYDAPVVVARSGGFYREAVGFIKAWLTAALKDAGQALAFAVLTGVQRISKESIFSDLNNLKVSTPLNGLADERFGFSEAEVEALATYLGLDANLGELRDWYDGYRFGTADIYNPWSVLNYFAEGCVPGVYWANTSGNAVIGEFVRAAGADRLGEVYGLLESGGQLVSRLNLNVVFPESGVGGDEVWSLLYLAGYLTTGDTEYPDLPRVPRRLRIPNREVGEVFRGEIIDRFSLAAGGESRLADLHVALAAGDAAGVERGLSRILVTQASYHDLTGENSYHMLMLGLLFGMPGYGDPVSNREAGDGRFDIRLSPAFAGSPLTPAYLLPPGGVPAITLELKVLGRGEGAATSKDGSDALALRSRAAEALDQIRGCRYDEADAGLPAGRLRYGVAFCGKRVAVACERA